MADVLWQQNAPASLKGWEVISVTLMPRGCACSTADAMNSVDGSKTIGEFVDLYESGRLDPSPSFRRQSAKHGRRRWSIRDRRLLIQSILTGDYQAVEDPISLHSRADDSVKPTYRRQGAP